MDVPPSFEGVSVKGCSRDSHQCIMTGQMELSASPKASLCSSGPRKSWALGSADPARY